MGSFARAFAKGITRSFASALGRRGGTHLGSAVSINGTFTDSTGWALGTSCTVTGGLLLCQNNAGNSTNTYAISLPAGIYQVTYDIVAPFNAGNITARFNGGAFNGLTRSFGAQSAGTYTEDIACSAAITNFEFRVTRSGVTMDLRLDNLVIKPYVQD